MTIERIIMIVAGMMIMLTVALGILHHEYWLYFTAFIGFNMFQSGFTQFCPLAIILDKAGVPSCAKKS